MKKKSFDSTFYCSMRAETREGKKKKNNISYLFHHSIIVVWESRKNGTVERKKSLNELTVQR
jgi:hypothetical protein